LIVTLSCHKLNGKFTRNIIVTTNDPEHPQETLVCKGQILEPARVEPPYVNFGRVFDNAGDKRTVTLARGDGGLLKPRIVPDRTQGLAAAINEIEAGERYEIVVTLTPPLKPGRIRTNVQVETGVPQAPNFNIPVFATITAPPPNQGTPTAGANNAAGPGRHQSGAPSQP